LNHILDTLFAHPSSIQVSLYGSVIITLWLSEWLRQPQAVRLKLRHTSLNALFILTALPLQLLMMVPCLFLARWTGEHQFGLIYLLPDPEQPWIKYGLMFVVLDLLDYVYHRTAHHVRLMWRFHSIHHTDLAVDVTTTVREHPGETLIRNCFLITYVVLCGASIEVLILRQSAQTMANLSSHTALRLPERVARVVAWIFITPNLHHAHHHYMLPTTNRNFGDVLSIWDRLFGTLVHHTREDIVFGLNGRMDGAVEAWLVARVRQLRGMFSPRPIPAALSEVVVRS
jgi:sterol desaturase/sphingolipid hydroxylase (fatty acid hydroxylase superfamily)